MFTKRFYGAVLTAAVISLSGTWSGTESCFAAQARSSNQELTLQHLKSAAYQIPDLTCGYTVVKLVDGTGENDGVKAVFGRAVFGNLAGEKTPTAVVHIAYHTDELGWLQQLVFIKAKGHQLLQVAEYGLDDREALKDMYIRNGELVVETEQSHGAQLADKLTKIKMADTRQGCMLQVSEWDRLPGNKQLVPHVDMSPYLYTVEDSIGRHWLPTQKDRGEHVVVAFTIKPSGEVADVRVANSSEVHTADEAAVEAVHQAAPFPPLPQGSNEPLNLCLEFQAGVNLKQ